MGISLLSVKLQSSNLRFDNMSFDWPRVRRCVSQLSQCDYNCSDTNWDGAGQLDLLQIVPVFIASTVSIIIINIIRIGRGRERVVIRLLDS